MLLLVCNPLRIYMQIYLFFVWHTSMCIFVNSELLLYQRLELTVYQCLWKRSRDHYILPYNIDMLPYYRKEDIVNETVGVFCRVPKAYRLKTKQPCMPYLFSDSLVLWNKVMKFNLPCIVLFTSSWVCCPNWPAIQLWWQSSAESWTKQY